MLPPSDSSVGRDLCRITAKSASLAAFVIVIGLLIVNR